MSEGVITIAEDATVQDAAAEMRDATIRGLLVTNQSGDAEGIVVARDIAYKNVADAADPENMNVADIMTEDLVTCRPDQDVEEAAHMMLENDVSRLPVMEDGEPVGIITEADLVRAWPPYFDMLAEFEELITSINHEAAHQP